MEAWPLTWPNGWPRTESPQPARFNSSFARCRDLLFRELKLLKASEVVLSSNLTLRQDGLPYAHQQEPGDSGVAVYFVLDGEHQCIPCDSWVKAKDNIQAIRMTVWALRGLERWGAKTMVKAAFQGFKALEYDGPAKLEAPDFFVGLSNLDEVKRFYKQGAKVRHPDVGGDLETWKEFARQYEVALMRCGHGG